MALSGVPAHITLIVPWLPPDEINDEDMAELEDELSHTKAFDFKLDAVSWFGRRVLWLAPSPVEPFRALTAALADRFSTPPWEDEFDEVIPHLTIGHASDGVELASAATVLQQHLPVHCRAEEVWVMVGDGHRWTVRGHIPLG